MPFLYPWLLNFQKIWLQRNSPCCFLFFPAVFCFAFASRSDWASIQGQASYSQSPIWDRGQLFNMGHSTGSKSFLIIYRCQVSRGCPVVYASPQIKPLMDFSSCPDLAFLYPPSLLQGSCTPLMVATLQPPSAGIAPQYSLPLGLGTGVGRPTLLEHTATVLVKQQGHPWRNPFTLTNNAISFPPFLYIVCFQSFLSTQG